MASASCSPETTTTASGGGLRITAGILLLAALTGWAFWLHATPAYGRGASWALITGAVFGLVMQRSRFCFLCGLRDWFEKRDGRPVLGLLAALATGCLGYTVIYGAWVPFPEAGHLPPRAHIAPAGWHLIVGGILFGAGMALSGSCISAHFYRLGEGSVLSPFALVGAAGGFLLGFKAWPFFYLRAVTEATVIWLPKSLGYAGALVLQLTLLAALAIFIWLRSRHETATPSSDRTLRSIVRAVFVNRWPHWIGGIGVGALASAVYLRASPLGVTAELGRLARNFGERSGFIPDTLPGLDGLAGCSTAAQVTTAFSSNALFVIGLTVAAIASGFIAGQFQPEKPAPRRVVLALLGGILLGFGAQISIGCSIGTLLSGIHAFALSGWIFGIAMVAGVWGGLKVMKWVG